MLKERCDCFDEGDEDDDAEAEAALPPHRSTPFDALSSSSCCCRPFLILSLLPSSVSEVNLSSAWEVSASRSASLACHAIFLCANAGILRDSR